MTAAPQALACPICAKPMQSKAVESVIAGVCSDHGLWLAKGELRKIVEGLKLAEMQKARRVLRTQDLSRIAQESMRQGMVSRWWNRL